MAKSVNRVTLLGNLGADPILKHTSGGTAVCKFTVCTNDRFKDKQGQWQDRPEWHNCTAWARLAEIASEYLKKGRQVFLEGSLKTDCYEDKQGQKKYSTYINVSDLVLLGGKGDGAPRDEFDQRSGHAEPVNQALNMDDAPF
jgi:single-strand DNA-binding protein